MVSACLAGVPCRYDGRSRPDGAVVAAVARGTAVPLCAEVIAGLPTPRPPAEVQGGDGADVLDGTASVTTDDGEDVTEAFVRGAQAVASYLTEHGLTEAVLQSRSPSCGCGQIYDGSFTGTLVDGDGVLTATLKRSGVVVTSRAGIGGVAR